jgi:Flp pilus assembly protein TadG
VRTMRGHWRVGARARRGGQIAVMFAGSIVLFVLLCGVVVDIAYYWVGTLQAQRAADAAALAGAVYLPGDTTSAYSTARAAATKNGYTVGGSTLAVTPVQDAGDPRQLDVTITARIGTFFSRVVGITSWPVTVTSKGVYVLPVPMGSPDAYYGVGNYSVNNTTTNTASYTNASAPGYTSSPSFGAWSSPNNGWTTSNSYATSATNNQAQAWSSLRIPSISGATLDGIVVSFNAYDSTAAAACQVKAQISWNGGSTYSNHSSPLTIAPVPRGAPATSFSLGDPGDLSVWGGNHSWGTGDFGNSSFRVQLTYLKGSGCGTLSLNSLAVTVYSHTTTTTTSMTTTAGVYDGPNNTGTFLTSRGAWGAIITKGGDQSNGDAYSPTSSSLTTNQYHPDGYDYVVKLPAGGTIKVFDPGFCAMGSNGAGGSMGVGDHWIGSSGTPVSTYYTLWNTNGKPGLRSAWTEAYTSGSLFEGEKGFDPANTAPDVASGGGPGGATSGCDAYHNAWWTMPTGSLVAGTYAVQVQTTKTAHSGVAADSSQNQNTNAENMFALEAVGGADGSGNAPQFYGNGKMVVYNNLMGGTPPPVQKFYLAQIDRATGAGKTALIDLWDIGDISGTGTLRILSPDGGSQNYVNFTYTTDSSCRSVAGAMTCYSSGTSSPPVSSILTTLNGAQTTNGTWIHISVPLPADYGSTLNGHGGLWNNGWWQVEYTVTQGGNDTTTWQVSVSGNPVHLKIP